LAAMPMIERRGLTLLGVSVTNLDDGTDQLALHAQRDPGLAIDDAVDEVRRRYGTAAVTRAVLLGRRPRFSVPLLPDSLSPRARRRRSRRSGRGGATTGTAPSAAGPRASLPTSPGGQAASGRGTSSWSHAPRRRDPR